MIRRKIYENSGCNNPDFIDPYTLSEGEETFCVINDSDSFYFSEELDLFMAVHSYNFSISFTRNNDKVYSKVIFWDEYDFEPNKYGFHDTGGNTFKEELKNNLANNLNYLGNYYEKKLNENNYFWRVVITNNLK